MKKVSLTVATDDYDHFRDFRLGQVQAEGIETTWLTMDIHEVFSRFAANREWDVSELSFAKFVAQATEEHADIIGLPVYASRMFRMSSFYVNKKKGIKTPADLRGKKVGLPEWAQTAAVYTRGWLQHEIGVPLTEIYWYQAGTEQPGRTEKVELNLPNGLQLTRVTDKTLSAMVASGEQAEKTTFSETPTHRTTSAARLRHNRGSPYSPSETCRANGMAARHR